MKISMKKISIFLMIFLSISFAACAELSTNLNVKTVMVGNSKSMVDSKTFVDANGNIVIPTDKGYATVKYSYQGRVIVREDFLDKNGHLIDCIDGYAYKINHYKGRTLQGTEYYNAQGQPANGPDGYARQEITYLGRQHQSTRNYDAKGNPVGAHRITEYKKYQAINLVTSDSWYDTENKLTPGPNGYARVEYEYEGRTRSKITYIAADGSLYYYAKAGYAKMVSEYA